MASEAVKETRRHDAGPAGQDLANQDFAQHDQQRGRDDGAALPSVAAVALRGTALMLDLQLETARAIWQAQARSATFFGAPDFSSLFEVNDERARRVFSLAAEQFANAAGQARETLLALQREIAHVAEQNSVGAADSLQQRLLEAGRRTEQGLREIRRLSIEALGTMRSTDDDEQGDGERGQRGEGSEARTAERRRIPRKHG